MKLGRRLEENPFSAIEVTILEGNLGEYSTRSELYRSSLELHLSRRWPWASVEVHLKENCEGEEPLPVVCRSNPWCGLTQRDLDPWDVADAREEHWENFDLEFSARYQEVAQ